MFRFVIVSAMLALNATSGHAQAASPAQMYLLTANQAVLVSTFTSVADCMVAANAAQGKTVSNTTGPQGALVCVPIAK